MSVTGCNKTKSQEALAIELLNAKYNDQFLIEEIQSQNFLEKYYTVIAYQKDDTNVLFKAQVDFDGENISDNYVSKKLCERLSDKIARNLNELPGIFYIFCEPMVEVTVLKDVNITIEEYMKISPKNRFVIYLNYSPENALSGDVYSALSNLLKDVEGVSGQVQLYIMEEEMLKDVQDYVENHDALYDDYEDMVEQYLAGILEVENGKLTATKDEVERILGNKL